MPVRCHKYTAPTAYSSTVHPVGQFTMALSPEQFQAVHKGEFIAEPPPGYRDPMPGYSLYRTATGTILGVCAE